MSKRKAEAVEEEEEEDTMPDPIEADVMDTKCWLLRVPNDLAERWHVSQFRWGLYHEAKKKLKSQPGNQRLQEEAERKLKEALKASNLGRIAIDHSSGRAVGKLEVPSKVEGQPNETYQMNLEVDEQRVGQKAPHLKILQETVERDDESHEGASTKLRVAATVTDYWNVQETGRNWQDRNEAITSTRKTGNIQIEDEMEKNSESTGLNYIKPLQQHEITAKSKAAVERRTLPEQRAERRSRDEVQNELLDIFKENPLWTTKDLRERTNQPEQHLKACLQDIATLHERGPNRGNWELKEEYKS